MFNFPGSAKITERHIAWQWSSLKSAGSWVSVLKTTSKMYVLSKVCGTCSSCLFRGLEMLHNVWLSCFLLKLNIYNYTLILVFSGSATFSIFCLFLPILTYIQCHYYLKEKVFLKSFYPLWIN